MSHVAEQLESRGLVLVREQYEGQYLVSSPRLRYDVEGIPAFKSCLYLRSLEGTWSVEIPVSGDPAATPPTLWSGVDLNEAIATLVIAFKLPQSAWSGCEDLLRAFHVAANVASAGSNR